MTIDLYYDVGMFDITYECNVNIIWVLLLAVMQNIESYLQMKYVSKKQLCLLIIGLSSPVSLFLIF